MKRITSSLLALLLALSMLIGMVPAAYAAPADTIESIDPTETVDSTETEDVSDESEDVAAYAAEGGEETVTSIDLDTFLKWLETSSYTVNGASYPANENAVVNGKLVVKWSPKDGCYDTREGHKCTVKNVKATGNTPKRLNSDLLQFQLLEGQSDAVTVKNVKFVYVPATVTVCENSGWKGMFTADEKTPDAQLYFMTTGNVTFADCDFEKTVLTTFNTTGTTTVTNCSFKDVYNSYAIKDIRGANITVENTTITNCGGGIMISQPAETTEVNSVTLSDNTFANVDSSNEWSKKPTTRGIIQIAASGKYDKATLSVTNNNASNCGPVLRQLNSSATEKVEEIKESLTSQLGGTLYTTDSTAKPSEPTGVATVGTTTYKTLEEAISALNSTNYTLKLLDESKWDAATPVYWEAGTKSDYAATLTDALTAAYKANEGDIKIVCRPGADVGTMTHGHVADNITIFGNKAYISGGECDLEVDKYKFSRQTGKQDTTNGVYLDKNIDIIAYELDNLSVWGERNTEYTVSVNLTDCDGKAIEGEENVQRVYISGTSGVNNITLTGCDFMTNKTSVYSNADGAISINNCSFTGSAVPVNFNHKADGTQTVTVKNCGFTKCGNDGDWKQFAAPVRFVNSGSGTQTASVDTCTFTGTVGSNGDILIGDGRTGQESNDVSLTVMNTDATVQAQKPGYYDGTATDATKGAEEKVESSKTLNTSVEEMLPTALTAYVTVNNGTDKYETLDAAIAAAEPVGGVITYTVTGVVSTDATGWIQVAKAGLTADLTEVKFVGVGTGAGITINGGLAILADQSYDIDVSFENLTLRKPNPQYGGDYGHSTNYFTCWLRNKNAAGNTVTYTNCTFPNGACNNQYGKTVYDNCKFTNATSGKYNLWNYGGNTEIKNSTFTGTRGIKTYNEGTLAVAPTVKIEGTTFNGLTEKAAVVASKATDITFDNVTTMDCEKGTFEKDIENSGETTTITANGSGISGSFTITAEKGEEAAKDEFNISAGTFNSEVSSDYCADGFEVKANENGTYGVVGSTQTTKGTRENPYTLDDLSNMTRAEYIAAQERLGGTMYVTVGDYSYETNGTLGNGTADNSDRDSTKMNYYGAPGAKEGQYSDAAVGKNIVFVGGKITSNVTGYKSIDDIGTSLLLAVPAYTNVTFEGTTFKNVMSFNYQLYTSPWSQLGELKFDGCTFNGIIVGAIAAQTLTFNKCTFANYTNTVSANSSNPTWIRPAYGNWTKGDNEGQGGDFKSLTTINFTGNTVVSTRPVKFERIAQWEMPTTVTVTGNSFDISAQTDDTSTKNVGLYFGANAKFDLIAEGNTKSNATAGLYTGVYSAPDGVQYAGLPAGSTVKDSNGQDAVLEDAYEWKSTKKLTLKTTKEVAEVNGVKFATLAEAITAAENGKTITLLDDLTETDAADAAIVYNLTGKTLDLNGKTYTHNNFAHVFEGTGGTIKNGKMVCATGVSYALFIGDEGKTTNFTVDGVELTGGINIYNATGVVLKNLTVNGTNYYAVWLDKGAAATIESGTYNAGDVAAFNAAKGSALAITGGTVNTNGKPLMGESGGTLSVSGGTFDTETVKGYCAAGFVPVEKDGVYSVEEDKVAQIGDKTYPSLSDAIAAAKDGDTVTLLKSCNGNGIKIETKNFATKGLTVDFGGNTYSVGGVLVGSAGTGTNAFQLLEGGKVTFQNGTIAGVTEGTKPAEDTPNWHGAPALVIQNYCDLTLKSMTITGGDETVYTMSNNHGNIVIEDTTITAGKAKGYGSGPFAFDVCGYSSYTGVSVTVRGNSTINGDIEVSRSASNKNPVGLTLESGTMTGKLKIDGSITLGDATTITKTADVTLAAPDGYEWSAADENGNATLFKPVAQIGKVNYASLKDAYDAAAGGKTIKLLADCESERINLTKNIEVNLNGHTLKSTSAYGVMFCARDGYKIKITGKTEGSKLIGTVMVTANTNGKIELNGGTYENEQYCPVYINGQSTEGTQLTVSNAAIIAKSATSTEETGVGVYLAGECTTKFTNTTITAPVTALEIRAGQLTLKNCNLTGGKGTLSAGANGNGSTVANAALAISQHTTQKNIQVTVIGGTYEATAAIYQSAVQQPIASGSVKAEVISGTFNGVIKAESQTETEKVLQIKGGTFDRKPDAKYIADGYECNANTDGTYGVQINDAVASVNGVTYAKLQAAIDAAPRNGTVKLLANTCENVTISTPDVTLDLNGFTLNGSTGERKPALTVTARVTVKDSSEAQTGTIMREDTADNSGVSSHYVIDVQGSGWLTFESGNVKNNSGNTAGKGASLVRVGDDSVEKYPGLNIKGGTFTQDNFIVIKVDRGDLFLNGGTLNSKNSYAIENWHRATIKGGTVNGAVAAWTYSGGLNSDLTISGGTINGDVTSVNYGNAEGKTAKVSITGGTINGKLDTRSYNPATNELTSIDDAAKATIEVTGGTFNNDPTKYVVENSKVTNNGDGTFGVEKAYLAKIGDKSYYTMDEAFHAVTEGQTIVLLRDYTTASSQNSGSKSFTFDLNGHTWTYTSTDVNCAAFEINYPDVTLTVKNGNVVSNSMLGLIPSAMGGTITYDNAGLVFEGIDATAKGHSGIETNGSNTNDSVTLKDSTLNVPNGFGIYFPSSGTLTIDNSTINAKTMGVQVCAGSLSINEGSAITVSDGPVDKTENDGAIQDGAAISIVNRTGYKGLGTITVTGGTFTAKSGNAAIKAYNYADKTESSFTESDKVEVSGGTFSAEVPADLCAVGYEPTEKDPSTGMYTVQKVSGNAYYVDDSGKPVYGDFAALVASTNTATKGKTITLLKNVKIEDNLVLFGNRTVDLNGNVLEITEIFIGLYGKVIDSSDGNGLLKIAADNVTLQSDNGLLPIYDSAKGGYRLFNVQMKGMTEGKGNGVVVKLMPSFTNKDAYKLMKVGSTNNITFAVTISWMSENGPASQEFTFDQSLVNRVAESWMNGKYGYFIITLTGLDSDVVGSIKDIKAQGSIKSGTGARIDSIYYDIPQN